MSLTDFKPHFDNAYQEVFPKVLVSKAIMNTRFEPTLKFGESIERVAYDISAVLVRDTVRGSASTIDQITDSGELLTVNIEKEAVFHISDGEVTQAGPLNPGEVIGGQVAIKVATALDALCFAEVLNAAYDFDAGDLTTLSSSGAGITLDSTTVPQLVSRAPAKLRRTANQNIMTNMAFVVDSYAASSIVQYLLGKSIDLAGSVFKNGYTGDVSNAQLYVSENLTGEAVLHMDTNPSNGETVTINGVVFTFLATMAATPGSIHIAGSVDATRANFVEFLNAGGATTEAEDTNTGYTALSAADQLVIAGLNLTATNDNTADDMTIVCKGSGRLILSETLATDAGEAWTKNIIHCYFGKKGAIDLVVQDMKEVDMRPTADRRGTNVFSSFLAGIKTFADGAKKFLDVHVNA